jgi:hypothetical protein
MPDLDLTHPLLSPALSPGTVAFQREAASVALDACHGAAPVAGGWHVGGLVPAEHAFQLNWAPATEQMRASHANDTDATEDGAYAIAIAAMEASGFRVFARAKQRSGADYLMAPVGGSDEEFLKLEVSGIWRDGDWGARLRVKTMQVRKGIQRPGCAMVVHFAEPRVAVGSF